MATIYLLDTSVLLTLINGKELGRKIDATYGFRASPYKPLACVVTHGELWALARKNGFGEHKRASIARALDEVTTVDVFDDDVIRAYADVYEALHRHPKGSRTNIGQNDMWIAAAARAAGATLLTLDKDFDPLHPDLIQRIYIERSLPSSAGPDDA